MDNQTPPFQIGQRVVCVKDNWNKKNSPVGIIAPKKKQTLTVREIKPDRDGRSLWYLRFEEIVNPKVHGIGGYLEPSFISDAFAPITETYTDIRESLALEAMTSVNDNADQPIKQLINN